MIPNDFGLIRQKEHSLISAFYGDLNLSECSMEVLMLDYTDHSYIASGTGKPSAPGSSVAQAWARADVSKFDYVLIPVVSPVTLETRSGLSTDVDTAFDQIFVASKSNINNDMICAYALFDLTKHPTYRIANINSSVKLHLPILGFIRHRSDNVNPKGLTNADSKSLQSAKADKLDQEAERIRDEVSGDAKEPVLDSVTGDRAAAAGDGEAAG